MNVAPAGQVVLTEGVAATCRPAGKLSVNVTPVRSTVLLGFVKVKVRVEVSLNGMLVGEKSLLMVGGATTVMTAFEVFPVPKSEPTVTLLFNAPAVVPVTFTETVQAPPGLRLAADKPTLLEPSAAVAVPLQVLLKLPGVATTRPVGRVSVKVTPVSVRLAFVLVIVNVRLVVPFSAIVAAPNTFVIDGGLITVRLGLAVDVLPLPWSLESMVTLLLYTPSLVPCTSTVMVQVPAAKVPFAKLMVLLPAVAVTVPPHVLTMLGEVATTRFAVALFDGRLSVKLASIVNAFGLVMVNVIVLGAFTATVVGLKLFVIEGGTPHAVATKPSKNAATPAARQPFHHCTFNAWITSFNLPFPPRRQHGDHVLIAKEASRRFSHFRESVICSVQLYPPDCWEEKPNLRNYVLDKSMSKA